MKIKIKAHSIDMVESKYEKQEGGFYLLEMEGPVLVEDLFKLVRGDPTGIIILINGISNYKSDIQLQDGDTVDMFRLYAGG